MNKEKSKLKLWFFGDESQRGTPSKGVKNAFEASAMEMVKPIIEKQDLAKSLYYNLAPEINHINAILKKSDIHKKINLQITGEDKTEVVLSASHENSYNETYLVLEAQQDGVFISSKPAGECYDPDYEPFNYSNTEVAIDMCHDMDSVIEMANAVVQNHILKEDEMKKVGLTLHEQQKQAQATHAHRTPDRVVNPLFIQVYNMFD